MDPMTLAMLMSAGGALGGGLSSFFGKDPSKDAMKYLDQIGGKISPYFDPYINAGKWALPGMQEQFGKLVNDPAAMLNKIGAGYQKSPGFDFAMKQALQGAGHAAAAGGMAGSPMHEQQNMDLATNLANQDYNNWLQQATGMYNTGLSGMGGMANMGFNASKSLADQIAQAMAAKAQLSYAGQANKNQGMSGIFGGIGGLLPFAFGK